jgi:hypothetical protein
VVFLEEAQSWREAMNALERIPASPPIGGPLWTIIIPAALLLLSITLTIMLYRKFSGESE